MKRLSSESPLKNERYLKSEKLFFDSSKLFAAQITELLDFVWPTATAMWNLRWQVNGYLEARDETITVEELFSKFGSDNKTVRANLFRACVYSTWDEQQEQFARFLLINAFAYFECWVSEILSNLGISNKQTLEKQLQKPSNHPEKGVLEALKTLKPSESKVLKSTFYPVFTQNEKYSIFELNNLLICYRYFKESRNAIIHRGGRTDIILESASIRFDSLRNVDLKAKEKPAYFSFSIGDPVRLNIRGVIGFLDIMLKIVSTLDAEILCSSLAEPILLSKWKKFVGIRSVKKLHPHRHNKLCSLAKTCSLPKPTSTIDLEEWLVQNNLIN